jgi:hypothetical protein
MPDRPITNFTFKTGAKGPSYGPGSDGEKGTALFM